MIATLLILTGQVSTDVKYMNRAVYMAASELKDPLAPGGFGTSDRKPMEIRDRNLLGTAARAVLSRTKTGFTLWLVNGGREPAWFRAADSNILGWLEAKDGSGNWKPIEYHVWSDCGNSYHRVAALPGHGWRFDVAIPNGKLKTSVRWRTIGADGTDIVSNEVGANIPLERFSLSPNTEKDNRLQSATVPILMPKSL